jgi:hypothetical protein
VNPGRGPTGISAERAGDLWIRYGAVVAAPRPGVYPDRNTWHRDLNTSAATARFSSTSCMPIGSHRRYGISGRARTLMAVRRKKNNQGEKIA